MGEGAEDVVPIVHAGVQGTEVYALVPVIGSLEHVRLLVPRGYVGMDIECVWDRHLGRANIGHYDLPSKRDKVINQGQTYAGRGASYNCDGRSHGFSNEVLEAKRPQERK